MSHHYERFDAAGSKSLRTHENIYRELQTLYIHLALTSGSDELAAASDGARYMESLNHPTIPVYAVADDGCYSMGAAASCGDEAPGALSSYMQLTCSRSVSQGRCDYPASRPVRTLPFRWRAI